jgi:hypothetical protein
LSELRRNRGGGSINGIVNVGAFGSRVDLAGMVAADHEAAHDRCGLASARFKVNDHRFDLSLELTQSG